MQSRLRNAPIKRKLTAITMLSSGVALVLACLAFVTYDVVVFREALIEDLLTTARIVSDNSAAALAFEDPASAEQTLRSLNTHPHIVGAALYGRDGELFTKYQRVTPRRPFEPPAVESSSHRFEDDHLKLFHAFALAGEPAGTLYIESDLTALRNRISRYVLIGLIVLIVSSAVAFLLTAKLQAMISGPISHLAGVMRLVTAGNDYSVRASKHGDDELGSLIDGFNTMLDQIGQQDGALQEAHHHLEKRVSDRTRQLLRQIAEREQAQAELERIHQQLLEASRQAGMAEVATNVLHNVGNVLNSVNVSTGILTEQIERSKVHGLQRLLALLEEHAHDLSDFVSNDARGRHVPVYLAQLSQHLLAEREVNLKELESLRNNVEHIKEIVSMQQSYSKVSGATEIVNVVDLMEDTVRMNDSALRRHGIEIVRQFEPVPLVNTQKHKVLQILVNLVGNAKYACSAAKRADRRVTLKVENGAGSVRISICDNGIGIAPENMTRIFAHGFTTRRDGHGFGLHSGALAAQELGGSLRAHSAGIGQGATFVLELPTTQERAHA